ncbi:MAG: class I SAM-dependent methyltransferase [Clostridiales bacterium]|nr:class I SAM-dependent methyltransferase [Clostridiales bacterium]
MNNKWDNVANDWNKAMGNGDWFQRYIIYPTLLSLFPKPKNKKIIDVGCGNGHLSRFFEKKGGKVTGIDKSKKMIESCKTYSSPINYLAFDITKTEFYENGFDLAIFNNSLQDMKNYKSGIKNAYKLLKTGGKLLIAVKHPCFHPANELMGWNVVSADGQTFRSGQGLTDLANLNTSYEADYFAIDDYLNSIEHTRIWYGKKTTSYSRTVEDYVNTIIDCGFIIKKIREPKPINEGATENPCLFQLLSRIPNFIFILAEKQGR